MSIAIFPSGPFETNAYVVNCPDTNEAVIIDAPPDSCEKITEYISRNNLIPKLLIFTHSHWDHIADASKLIKKFPLQTVIHPLDAQNLENPGSDRLPCWISIEGVNPTRFIDEGDQIRCGNLLFDVIHTPGHTPGGVCFYLPTHHLLFSGDTLFKGTIGNLSFPTAQPHLMWQSLPKLGRLPKETRVFPGHGESTTIGNEPWLNNAENYFG